MTVLCVLLFIGQFWLWGSCSYIPTQFTTFLLMCDGTEFPILLSNCSLQAVVTSLFFPKTSLINWLLKGLRSFKLEPWCFCAFSLQSLYCYPDLVLDEQFVLLLRKWLKCHWKSSRSGQGYCWEFFFFFNFMLYFVRVWIYLKRPNVHTWVTQEN